MDLEVVESAQRAAERAGRLLVERAGAARAKRGSAVVAVSGGASPIAMFDSLSREPFDWSTLTLTQVDERIAPRGSPDRNATHLVEHLVDRVHQLGERYLPMPVDADDLEVATSTYEAELHSRLGDDLVIDVVHLGLGPDGHTASLTPGDAVLEVADRDVALTGMYKGFRRMTLTYPAIERASFVLWLVVGVEKREVLERLLDRDVTIPAGRLAGTTGVVIADEAAAGRRPS